MELQLSLTHLKAGLKETGVAFCLTQAQDGKWKVTKAPHTYPPTASVAVTLSPLSPPLTNQAAKRFNSLMASERTHILPPSVLIPTGAFREMGSSIMPWPWTAGRKRPPIRSEKTAMMRRRKKILRIWIQLLLQSNSD